MTEKRDLALELATLAVAGADSDADPAALADVYATADKAVEAAGDDRARIALGLLEASPGTSDGPFDRIERFTAIATALKTRGVWASIYEDQNYEMTVL